MAKGRETPHQIRKCAVCGVRAKKDSLLRFGCDAAGPFFDRQQRAAGRGMYVHPQPSCWSRMGDLKLWERALKIERGRARPERIRQAMDSARELIPDLAEPAAPRTPRRIKMI